MIPKQPLFSVVITIDCLIWLPALIVERKIERSFPSRLSPESHWLSIRTHFSFQAMSVWNCWNFIQKLSHRIKWRRKINWQYMPSFDIVTVDHIDWSVLEGQNGGARKAWHEISIDLPCICEHFRCRKSLRKKLMLGSHSGDLVDVNWIRP